MASTYPTSPSRGAPLFPHECFFDLCPESSRRRLFLFECLLCVLGLFVVLSELGVRIGNWLRAKNAATDCLRSPLLPQRAEREASKSVIGFAVFGLYHGVINCGFVCVISLAAMANLVDQRTPLCFELLGVFLLESVVTITLRVWRYKVCTSGKLPSALALRARRSFLTCQTSW